MALYDYLNTASFITNTAATFLEHQQNVRRDEGLIRQAKAQALQNNRLAERNLQLISEEQMVTMKAHGLDSFEIAKQIRAAQASELAKRGGDGALSSGALRGSLANIQRLGSEALYRKSLNFGRAYRNLNLEKENVSITTAGLNAQAFNQISLSTNGTGTTLKLLGTGLNSFRKYGFTVDPKTNKVIPKWES